MMQTAAEAQSAISTAHQKVRNFDGRGLTHHGRDGAAGGVGRWCAARGTRGVGDSLGV